ncbi:MAG: hypothetical protein GX050_09575 [Firmicutes bacterium]|nr:hypothetical protein [Bacillota bacterium]
MKRLRLVLLLGFILGALYVVYDSGRNPFLPLLGISKTPFNMRLISFYASCRHEEAAEEAIRHDQWEVMLDTLIEDGWELKRISPTEVELGKEFFALCPDCREKEFIGIYGDEIGVYAGSPERPGPLKQVIPVKIGKLPAEEVNDLRAGDSL